MPEVLMEKAAPPKLARILMPVEFSGRCERVALYAQSLAHHFHSEVVLLHAVSPPVLPYGASEGLAYAGVEHLSEQVLTERTAMLESFLAPELAGIPVRRIVTEGDPGHKIVEYAAEEHCDLILMPTHGYGSVRRILVGSITAGVLRHAPCPVLTGPHLENAPAPETVGFRRILCALDLCPESEAVLAWAAGFAHEFGAMLRIVHVIPETAWRAGGLYFDPDWQIHLAKEAREKIDDLKEELHAEAEVGIEIGDVPAAVTTVAGEWQPDLLVIGRGARQGVLGRLRAKAYAILRESACPVVAI
jgi:nucleotide-binding universal stress UspA family protein